MSSNITIDDAIDEFQKFREKVNRLYKLECDANERLKNELATKTEEVM